MSRVVILTVFAAIATGPTPAVPVGKKVVFVAGTKTHGFGVYQYKAGCRLLARALEEAMPGWEGVVVEDGYPADETVFDGASAVILYCDSGPAHVLAKSLSSFEKVMTRGVGVGCLQKGVIAPAGNTGNAMLRWIGGYYESNGSVNSHWSPSFSAIAEHGVSAGVTGFAFRDERFFHMRFQAESKGLTTVLSASPSAAILARSRTGGQTAGGDDQTAIQRVMWIYERMEGKGRGFGFTGGTVHWSWAQDSQRMLVLNAIIWIAGEDVPAGGAKSRRPTIEELMAQDNPAPPTFDKHGLAKAIELMNSPQKAR